MESRRSAWDGGTLDPDAGTSGRREPSLPAPISLMYTKFRQNVYSLYTKLHKNVYKLYTKSHKIVYKTSD